MVLFPHDARMVEQVGESSYVRWMDDQTFGVRSRAEGLRLLNEVSRSLSRLHLTPNASKSRVMSLGDARRHYHLDINDRINSVSVLPHGTPKERKALRRELDRVWKFAVKFERQGEWAKVLKRIYLLAGLGLSRRLRRRALRDVVAYPLLARRVSDYVRWTGSAGEFLGFLTALWAHPEQIYSDVSVTTVETLLLLEASNVERIQLRQLGKRILRGQVQLAGTKDCQAIAPLILLRFGDRRSLDLLRRCFESRVNSVPAPVRRAAAVVYASCEHRELNTVRKAFSRLKRNQLAEIVRLTDRISRYRALTSRHLMRFRVVRDSSTERLFVDMRDLLAVRLFLLNRNSGVLAALKGAKTKLLRENISQFERTLIRRLLRV